MGLVSRLLSRHEEEQSQDNFSIFRNDKNYSLISELCFGHKTLPTPAFFGFLIKENKNKNVEKFLILAQNESLKFYRNTFSIALKFKDDFKEFSKNFNENIQPIGQKIINIMILLNLYSYEEELKSSGSIFTKTINKIRLIIKEKTLEKSHVEKIIYLFMSLFSIAIASILSFYFAGGFKSIVAASSASLISFLATCLLAVISYKKYDFEHTDISGRNLIALKYRAVFYSALSHLEKKTQHSEKNHNNFLVNYNSSNSVVEKILEIA